MTTMSFNKVFSENVWKYQNMGLDSDYEEFIDDNIEKYSKVYQKRFNSAMFGSRVFTLPKEEVCNYFIWRQQDATRNAIQMVGQANFSHKQLQNKNCDQIQEMLFQEKEINFNDVPTYQKHGVSIFKEFYMKDDIERSRWVVDENIPIFTQDRDYIEKYI
jgi:tRNA(His) guanylyltransferase